MIDLLSPEDRRATVRISGVTLGFVVGLWTLHNALCNMSCHTSPAYLLDDLSALSVLLVSSPVGLSRERLDEVLDRLPARLRPSRTSVDRVVEQADRVAQRVPERLRGRAERDEGEPVSETLSDVSTLSGRYRTHAVLRRRSGLDYLDRGPAKWADVDLLRLDDERLDDLVDEPVEPALPGDADVDDLDEQDVEQVREWRDDVEDGLRSSLATGATQGDRLRRRLDDEQDLDPDDVEAVAVLVDGEWRETETPEGLPGGDP